MPRQLFRLATPLLLAAYALANPLGYLLHSHAHPHSHEQVADEPSELCQHFHRHAHDHAGAHAHCPAHDHDHADHEPRAVASSEHQGQHGVSSSHGAHDINDCSICRSLGQQPLASAPPVLLASARIVERLKERSPAVVRLGVCGLFHSRAPPALFG